MTQDQAAQLIELLDSTRRVIAFLGAGALLIMAAGFIGVAVAIRIVVVKMGPVPQPIQLPSPIRVPVSEKRLDAPPE